MAPTRKHLIVTVHPVTRHEYGYSTMLSLGVQPPRTNIDAATPDEAHQAITAWVDSVELPEGGFDGKPYDGWSISVRPGTYDPDTRRVTTGRWAPGWKARFDRSFIHPATRPTAAADTGADAR
ncbi:MAG: hypothetical protein AB7H92_19295 [Microbacteriaceae bacterium]